MSVRHRFTLLLICFLALAGISPASLQTWQYSAETLTSFHPPSNLIPLTQPLQADLDSDLQPECLRTTGGRTELHSTPCVSSSPGAYLWKSPPEWNIAQAQFTDLNRDGQPEIALLVWRPFKPWPIDRYIPFPGRIDSFHDQENQSCHLILIGWRRDAYREIWAGSALVDPLLAFAAADLDADGFQELIILESEYDDPPGKAALSLSVWEWNGFGFSLLARAQGAFQKMSILSAPSGNNYILTHK